MSKNALSTLMRDLADVSMNLQPKDFASASPSGNEVSQYDSSRGK